MRGADWLHDIEMTRYNQKHGIEPLTPNPKDACGELKPSLHLIPASAQIAEALVLKHGADKYGPYNWRETNPKAVCYYDAATRHLLSWLDGEDNDPESGISHLAHVRACMGILIDAFETGCVDDNRPAIGTASELIRKFTKTANLQSPEVRHGTQDQPRESC